MYISDRMHGRMYDHVAQTSQYVLYGTCMYVLYVLYIQVNMSAVHQLFSAFEHTPFRILGFETDHVPVWKEGVGCSTSFLSCSFFILFLPPPLFLHT